MHTLSSKIRQLSPIGRYFTRADTSAYDLIDLDRIDGFERPSHWSPEATRAFAEASSHSDIPAHVKAIEENTVPSWLWRHARRGKENSAETSATQIFDRFVGSAVYHGWKQKLFAQEADALLYAEEMRYALAQRYITIEPSWLAKAGSEWAYGIISQAQSVMPAPQKRTVIDIDNQTIDTVVSGRTGQASRATWQQALSHRRDTLPLHIRFTDTVKQWGVDITASTESSAAAVIDLLALRHNNGQLNIDLLKHVVRLTVVMLDLQDDNGTVARPISFTNIAPLLMSLAIAYDSDEARATTAAISAIITAESYITLAELSKLHGKSQAFIDNVDGVMRTLRNHCRAAYGDHADYERTSILPTPLELKAGADLALIAEAQRSWDKAVEAARKFGLRQIHATTFCVSPLLSFISESAAQDIAPLKSLVNVCTADGETFKRDIHLSAIEGLKRLGYDRVQTKALTVYAVGAQSLKQAPAINHASLRKAGLNDAAIGQIENYLPSVDRIQLAITPWIVGEDFCIDVLKIKPDTLEQPAFSLLQHLGFSVDDIATANAWCYGHDSFAQAAELQSKHRPVFAMQRDLSTEARIRMASAVQSFISDDVTTHLTLSAQLPAEKLEKIFLEAWRQGLKSLTIDFISSETSKAVQPVAQTAAKNKAASFLHAQKPHALPQRKMRAKAQEKLVAARPKSRKILFKTKD